MHSAALDAGILAETGAAASTSMRPLAGQAAPSRKLPLGLLLQWQCCLSRCLSGPALAVQRVLVALSGAGPALQWLAVRCIKKDVSHSSAWGHMSLTETQLACRHLLKP